jgi:hypothetical protein
VLAACPDAATRVRRLSQDAQFSFLLNHAGESIKRGFAYILVVLEDGCVNRHSLLFGQAVVIAED